MSRRLLSLGLIAVSVVILAGAAHARADDATPAPTPATVHLGIYLANVDSFDLKAGTATVTYYLWTRWSGELDGAAFELRNGTIESKDSEYKYTEGDVTYHYYRGRATVRLDLDFRAFPLDSHTVELEFEHAELGAYYLVVEIDTEAMKRLGSPPISGWETEAPRYDVRTVTYPTNWGVPGASPDDDTTASRFRVSIRIRHSRTVTFVNVFLPLFISMLITFLAFLMHPEELEARIGIGVAGVFGAATSYSIASDRLPEISYMTLSDKLHLTSFLFVFVVILETSVMGWLARQERVDEARRLDNRAGPAIVVLYTLAMVVFIVTR